MAVRSIADYKPLFKIARQRGIKIQAVVVNPESLVSLISAIAGLGENPFPRAQRSWKHFWHKPDIRPFLFGIPVALNPSIPPGLVGCATLMPMPPDMAEMFAGDLNLMPQAQASLPTEPKPEPGAMAMLSQSVNAERATLSDLMFKAMDGLDGANGIVVLRFYGDRFDVTTNFNPLECQAILQRTAMRVMSEGLGN